MPPPRPPGRRSSTCAELLDRLEHSGMVPEPNRSDSESLLALAAEPSLVPLRFDLRLEERPVVTFARGPAGDAARDELSFPLDRRVADLLRARFATQPIDSPDLLLAGGGRAAEPVPGPGMAGGDAADVEAATQALRALEHDDLRVRRLEVLREALLAADLGSTDSTLGALLEALLDLTGAERGAVFLVEGDEPKVRLHRDRTGSGEEPILPRRVLRRALERAAVFTSEDVTDDAELYRDTVVELHIKSLLVAPLVKDGQVRALVYLDRRLSAATFSEEIVALFGGLAEDLFRLLDTAVERERLHAEVARLEANEPVGEFKVSGGGTVMAALLSRVRRAAATRQPILILGETGSGKTLLAEGVHRLSAQARGAFVHVRVPEIAEQLFESEMFGHEKGAFTGALSARRGLLAEANGGTLFLDEIGRLSPAMQSKLLGALEGDSATFRRVGGGEQRSRFRLLAATSVDLERESREGRFLPDLWWRLAAGLVVRLPPLRERPEDVVLLAEHLARQIAVAEGFEPARLDAEAGELLGRHRWPGNVRELKAVVQRAFWNAQIRTMEPRPGEGRPASASEPLVIRREDLALDLSAERRAVPVARTPGDPWLRLLESSGWTFPDGEGLSEELEHIRGWRIRKALAETGNNEAEAARRLGFRSPSTFRSQLQRLGIKIVKRTEAGDGGVSGAGAGDGRDDGEVA